MKQNIQAFFHEDKEKEEIHSPLVKPKKKRKKFSIRSTIMSLRSKLGLKSKDIDRPILFHIMQRRQNSFTKKESKTQTIKKQVKCEKNALWCLKPDNCFRLKVFNTVQH